MIIIITLWIVTFCEYLFCGYVYSMGTLKREWQLYFGTKEVLPRKDNFKLLWMSRSSLNGKIWVGFLWKA